MNPNRGESQPSFELPPQAPESNEKGMQGSQERAPARQEKPGNKPQQPLLPAIPNDIPDTTQPIIPATTDDIASASHGPPAIPDTDHIERIWLDKVKSVASQTKDDPFAQKHHMSQIKADYIQKRFGKNIKTDEPAA